MGFLSGKIKQLNNGREVLEMPDSVNFLIISKDKKLILASQKRAGNEEKETLNCFGGYIEKEDSNKPKQFTVFKELFEESNIPEEYVSRLHCVYLDKKVSVGYTTESSSLFIVELNKDISELELKCNDKKENITIKATSSSESEIYKMMKETNCLKFFLALDHLLRFKFSILK
ncbi:MAG: hypothetical protein ACRCX2_22025 [Paraclostridium sp.]